jgi:hypothetical protein
VIPPFRDDEELTRSGFPRATPLRVVSDPPPDDSPEYRHGQMMGAIGRLQTAVDELRTLPSEVRALRAEIRDDRSALVNGASKHASTHTSNRMAALLGALFTLYEIAGPALREVWRMVVHK